MHDKNKETRDIKHTHAFKSKEMEAYSRSELAHNEKSVKAGVVDDNTHARVGRYHVPPTLLACKNQTIDKTGKNGCYKWAFMEAKLVWIALGR